MSVRASRGFTLVEVLVALMVVALGLAALMVAVSSAARSGGSLRDKTLAQWIALNRIAEVRLTVNKIAPTNDTGQLEFGNRTWHYDTRYFDTSIATMKRITVRVWAGDTKTPGNPIAEATGFMGTALAQPGNSNTANWLQGASLAPTAAATGNSLGSAAQGTTSAAGTTTGSPSATTTSGGAQSTLP